MKVYSVTVTFELDAEDHDDAMHQAMNASPNGAVIEAIREVPDTGPVLPAPGFNVARLRPCSFCCDEPSQRRDCRWCNGSGMEYVGEEP